MIIDANKFLSYLIFSKHIDGLTCGEVKEAIEISKVDIFDKIRADIISLTNGDAPERIWNVDVLEIINKYKESEEHDHMTIDEFAELFIESEK